MMCPLCQRLLPLLSVTRNNDMVEAFTHTDAEMGISFPWLTLVIFRTKHCCRKCAQNKFSICLNNKEHKQRPEVLETDG